MSQFPNALTIIPMPVSDRIPSLPPRDLALNMANIPWELRQNTSWSPIRAYVTMFILHQEKSGMNIYIYIHTRIYTVSYVHIFYTRIWFLYIFFRGFQNMFSYYLWGPQLIVSRNVPRCKPIVGPIRTRKWIHLVQYPTPVAVWILNLKNCIAEWKCKQTINIYNHAAVAAK